MKIAVAGAGAFGTALAVTLSQNGPVTLWGRTQGAIETMQRHRQNPRLPQVALPENVALSADLETVFDADAILLAVPAQQLRGFVEMHRDRLAGKLLVSCAKGIDIATMTGACAAIGEHVPSATASVLTGPSFAADIAKGLPTALTLACEDDAAGKHLQEALSTPTLRLYRTTDVTGAELGGALKNVMAIACGTCIGRGLGDSARAAVMTRGFAEMQRLAIHFGAKSDTLMGLSGLGDLALTCTSDLSRNYRFGVALGRSEDFDPATTVEGAATAQAVTKLAQREGLDLPITAAVAALVLGKLRPEDAMQQLLSRPLKEE